MKKMAAGEFKANCLSVMKTVKATGEPVVITKRGTPMVKLVRAEPDEDDIFGFLANEMEITGDIESPVVPASAWKVMRK